VADPLLEALQKGGCRHEAAYLAHLESRGLAVIRAQGLDAADPWAAAAEAREPGNSDLVRYWVFKSEGGVRIERRVPLIPYIREVEQLARLSQPRRGIVEFWGTEARKGAPRLGR